MTHDVFFSVVGRLLELSAVLLITYFVYQNLREMREMNEKLDRLIEKN